PDVSSDADLVVEILDRIADGPELLGILVGNVDVELLLKLHDQLHDVEAVRTEVLDEARVIGKLLALDAELLLDDVADFLRVVIGHGRASSLLRLTGASGNLLRHEGGCHMTIPPSTTNTCPVMNVA